MIYFLYGSDTYRSRQKLNGIVEEYKKIHKSGLNLKYFDGENLKFEDLVDETQQVSMFGEKKLIVLTNIFSNQDFKEKFFKNSKKFIGSEEILIIFEEGTPRKEKFLEFLKIKAKSQEFGLLEGGDLKNWLKKEFLEYKVKINAPALDTLLDFVGNDLWQFSNEIKKLVNFKKNGTIEADDVKLLVKPVIETDIFKTIDAIAQKNKKQAITLIHNHLEKGEAPLYLLSMINFQFRNLIIIKDLVEKNKPYFTILKTVKMHPFVVKKSYQQVQKFSLSELKKIYQKIFEVDLNIKTGKVEPEVALDLFISSI